MDVLSQNEIDALLDALSTGEVELEALQEAQQKVKYIRYDFRRPNKFSKDQLRTLLVLHSGFARLLSSFLTGYLRNNIQIEVASADQLTYEDFIRSIPSPTVLVIFTLKPLAGTAIAQLDPMFLFPMIDLFFGGDGDTPRSVRELTDIELAVARKLSVIILDNLTLAWKDVIKVEPVIDSIETNPHLHQLFSFNEIVALITLTTQVGNSTKGFVNLCLPFPLLDPMVSQMTHQRRFGPQASAMSEQEKKKLEHWLGYPMIEITVLTGQTQITVDDFLQLQEGDVLLLDRRMDQDMDLYIGEQLKFKAQAGTLGNQLAVQITGLIKDDDNA